MNSSYQIDEANKGSREDKLHIDFQGKNAKGTFTVHSFVEEGHFISYLPSLNLSAYGNTKEEATERLFKEVFDDYMKNVLNLKPERILKELFKLGWAKNPFFNKRLTNSYIDKEGVLKNFNLPEETPIHTSVVSV